MPLPLKHGYNFNFDRLIRPPYSEMTAAEAYTDFYGISYMLKGEALVYSPIFTTLLQAGDIIFIPKNVYTRTTYASDSPRESILIKFTESMISELFNIVGIDAYNKLCDEYVIHCEKKTQDTVLDILSEMEQEWKNYNKYSELILKGLLHRLIVICLRERTIGGNTVENLEKKHTCLADAIKYVKAHLQENPSLAETAHYIHISPSYLSKIFISQLHTSFSAFVLNEKIQYAQRLLADSNLSMTQIALEAGFSSNAYFSDCFRRVMGISPMQFRKTNRNTF